MLTAQEVARVASEHDVRDEARWAPSVAPRSARHPRYETVEIWEFPPEGKRRRPSAHGVIVLSRRADRGRTLLLQLVAGDVAGEPTSTLYLDRRGPYELMRREEWPPLTPDERPRVLLKVRSAARRAARS